MFRCQDCIDLAIKAGYEPASRCPACLARLAKSKRGPKPHVSSFEAREAEYIGRKLERSKAHEIEADAPVIGWELSDHMLAKHKALIATPKPELDIEPVWPNLVKKPAKLIRPADVVLCSICESLAKLIAPKIASLCAECNGKALAQRNANMASALPKSETEYRLKQKADKARRIALIRAQHSAETQRLIAKRNAEHRQAILSRIRARRKARGKPVA